MEKIIVRGGEELKGTVHVEGAKNAALPILIATLLASEGKNTIYNVPSLTDVKTTIEILKYLGSEVIYSNKEVNIITGKHLKVTAPFEFVRKLRASVLFMGPLLAINGKAKIALPGGCAIGTRPIDQHIKGFKAMGVDINIGNGYIDAVVNKPLQGAEIYLDSPSVGATENIMMAATLAEGTTLIKNCAKEPEISDLAIFLNKMGARISGAGTDTIKIEGVKKLTGSSHSVMPDRIEAGTFMVATAITKGNVLVKGAKLEHLASLVAKLKDMGIKILEEENGLRVIGSKELKAVDIKTLPYPGFPTDMQPQMMALLLQAEGTSIITETVFENRFMHVNEFQRMNTNIKVDGRSAIINGPSNPSGAVVSATDLRAAAALILLGLASKDETTVTNLIHLDRGYVNFAHKLSSLGANITRFSQINDTEKSEKKISFNNH
ncbi:UDP-N-acetylglucosamine 1-carboxyvinyltransferase [Bacillus weihaiensis]|uniref:UDP-N-acetylglucosamine 1-carboxyvinyltransferase n=1 Tax=Bacillus weihaiensis TaxID=1547283 RepID=A0A1L3MWB8_9BACI|nr:UDP-N-acetylglucosamine 1-carboxyvinyltransferase [Bacillus weihaiensis]APH06624.1 UDP-N-acetylglucosamine 1-carboxyvinyltransferase [Bacillus weihaiensis]